MGENKCDGAEGNWKLLGANKDKVPLKDKKKLYRRSEKTNVKVFYVGIICSETLKFNITNINILQNKPRVVWSGQALYDSWLKARFELMPEGMDTLKELK